MPSIATMVTARIERTRKEQSRRVKGLTSGDIHHASVTAGSISGYARSMLVGVPAHHRSAHLLKVRTSQSEGFASDSSFMYIQLLGVKEQTATVFCLGSVIRNSRGLSTIGTRVVDLISNPVR